MNYYEKQLYPVKEEHLTPGALLEAVVDEISHKTKTTQQQANSNQSELLSVFQNFDQNVLKAINQIVIFTFFCFKKTKTFFVESFNRN